MPPTPTPSRSDIFLKFLDAVGASSREETLALLADDLKWIFRPSSIALPTVRKSGVDGMLSKLNDMLPKGSFKFTTNRVHETTEGIFFYEVQSDGISKFGSTWHNEYIFIVTLTPGGDKIARIEEFMDSKFVADFGAAEIVKASKAA